MGKNKRKRFKSGVSCTLSIGSDGKIVEEYPDGKKYKSDSTLTPYMIDHTKEHLSYERLEEHILQKGKKPVEDFWEIMGLDDEHKTAEVLSNFNLVEIKQF